MSSTPFKITKHGIVGNLTGSVQGTASYAITASYAENGGGSSSPFISGTGSGSAVLSGSSANASGQFAVAEGQYTIAPGNYSHAEGYSTGTSGDYSHAEGHYAIASGTGSHAEGDETKASGSYSHAEGFGTEASGTGSHAEGRGTEALGNYSHTEGQGTEASNAYEHAQGKYNATASGQIFSIGCGDNYARTKNAVSVITGSGTVPSASVYIYGIGGYNGTNPTPGVNDLATVIAGCGSDPNAFISASYNSTGKEIQFFNGAGTKVAFVDATEFIKDGMLASAYISSSYLVLTFNTDAGQEPISMSLLDIFDPSNYYTKNNLNPFTASVIAIESKTGSWEDKWDYDEATIQAVKVNSASGADSASYALTASYALEGGSGIEPATSTSYGAVKTNPDEGIILNDSGNLQVLGRLGQMTGGTGIYAPNTMKPTSVGDGTLLITEANDLTIGKKSLGVVTGANLSLKSAAAAGATQYVVRNTFTNRFLCALAALPGSRIALNEASATKTAKVVSVQGLTNGEPYSSGSSDDIVITVDTSVNPSASASQVRVYCGAGGYSNLFIGQAVGSAENGANIIAGQQVGCKSGNANLLAGANIFNAGNGNAILGRQHISKKNRWLMAGTGHDNTNGKAEVGTALGQFSLIRSSSNFVIGNGSSETSRKNLFEIESDGKVYVQGLGSYDGTNPQPGVNDLVTVVESGATIPGISTGSGTGSIQMGYLTTASGDYSHAQGSHTIASGPYSHAEGTYTTASFQGSHAEGLYTRALNFHSHAEGTYTTASGQYSHAEGYSVIASGNYSHAEGSWTRALGAGSHAEGSCTSASNAYEHAQGRFNAIASGQIFSVGCGDSEATRKNAISVITGSGTVPSASVYIYGIGGYDGTNPQPGVNDVVTIINNLIASVSVLSS